MPRYIISRLRVPVAEKHLIHFIICGPNLPGNEGRCFDQLRCNYTDEHENSLEIIIESVHFIKADSHEGFYEFLFYVLPA
jgi:hypothetical protein